MTLYSLHVSNYGDYPDSGLVSIGDSDPEWINYGRKVEFNGKHYLMPDFRYNVNTERIEWTGAFRNRFGGTQKQAHSQGDAIIPVVRMSQPHCGNANSPDYEEITLTDKAGS